MWTHFGNMEYGVKRHINILRTCKDITGLAVTNAGRGRKKRTETLGTGLLTFCVDLKC